LEAEVALAPSRSEGLVTARDRALEEIVDQRLEARARDQGLEDHRHTRLVANRAGNLHPGLVLIGEPLLGSFRDGRELGEAHRVLRVTGDVEIELVAVSDEKLAEVLREAAIEVVAAQEVVARDPEHEEIA